MDDPAEDVLAELREIKKMLRILAAEKLAECQKRLEQEVLTTVFRKQAYELFDGTRTYKQIGEAVGVTAESVRQFAVQAKEKGLVELLKGEAGTCPRRVEL